MAVMRYTLDKRHVLPTVRRAVALGVFDGLHIGHRLVMANACGAEDTDGRLLTATVLSITGVPKGETGRLLTPKREDQLLDTLGVDEWIDLPFAAIRDLSPATFVKTILKDTLNTGVVCCGHNYRFGKNGAGNVDTLRQLCAQYDIRVVVEDMVQCEGEAVSSTNVRQAIAAGDMTKAARLLGRPFSVELPVQSGAKRGRQWGTPTINQVFDTAYAVPRYGVYASLVVLGKKQYRAVTNIGIHPTVGGVKLPQAETWIQDFDGDLYGQTVQVLLVRFLREERQFATVEALKAQIAQDAKQANIVLCGDGTQAVLFDFDDTLQDRTMAFKAAMEQLIERHFPQADEAKRQEMAQDLLVKNNGGYVDYDAFFEEFAAAIPSENGVTGRALYEEYLRIFPLCTQLYDETEQVLKTLRRRGYRLGLITNGHTLLQNRKLDKAGIRPYLDGVAVSADEGVGKPNPEIFRRLAERLCVAPQDCVFVGDHPVNDIQGALDAGMRAVYLNTRNLDEYPDGVCEIKRLADILEKL